ncbi:MAG TPA: hypothetical protein ENI61_05320 [Ignavibacteria bacterium]|nr:hypothetical protein [Ignavibacteria bacterium]
MNLLETQQERRRNSILLAYEVEKYNINTITIKSRNFLEILGTIAYIGCGDQYNYYIDDYHNYFKVVKN